MESKAPGTPINFSPASAGNPRTSYKYKERTWKYFLGSGGAKERWIKVPGQSRAEAGGVAVKSEYRNEHSAEERRVMKLGARDIYKRVF